MRISWTFALCFAAAFVAAAPARADWREASSAHFVIYADEPEKDLREFTRNLEKFDQALRLQRGVTEATFDAQRLTIYVLPNQDALRRVYGAGGRWVGGFYVPRASGPVAYVTPPSEQSGVNLDGQFVLLHEYSHHFMFLHFPGAFPAWLVEGFAEFNGSARFERDGGVSIGLYSKSRLEGLQTSGVRIQQLFEDQRGRQERDVHLANYELGWALTHYLTMSKARAGQLETYVQALANGTPGMEAARQAFGDLSKLGVEVRQYAKKPIPYITMPAERFTDPAIAIRTLSKAEDAAIDVQLRADRGISKPEQAQALLPDARRMAAAWPEDPTAQSVLAQVEFWAGNDAEAIAAADRALKADPKRMRALIYKAQAMERAAEKAHGDAAAWAAARQPAITANRIDPNDPMPFLLYYRSYAVPHLPVPRAAIEGLYSAAALAPYDSDLAMLAAYRLVIEHNLPVARGLLAPIAYSPHARQPNRAATVIDLIDGGKPVPEILAAFEKASPSDEDD